MTLFLKFGDGRYGAPPPPGPIYPDGTVIEDDVPMLNGKPLHTAQVLEENPRPFVPSVAPEDLEKGFDLGILTPRNVNSLDAEATPFVAPRVPTWASKITGIDAATAHANSHKELLDDIGFLELQEEHAKHEEMLDEAADWLEDQEKILWGAPGVPHWFVDHNMANLKEQMPTKAIQEVRINGVYPTWSRGSIAGQPANVFIPWGSETNFEGPPGVKQPLLCRKPIRLYDFVFVEMVQDGTGWKATKIFPKLPTEEMLVSVVESITEYGGEYDELERSGFSYTFEVPCDPQNIGLMIGKNGRNLNTLIQGIQNKRKNYWYGPMPWHIDCENNEFPLPEVTIKPIEGPLSYFEMPSSFIPQKASVTVYLPTCCIWDEAEVINLVSFFHS